MHAIKSPINKPKVTALKSIVEAYTVNPVHISSIIKTFLYILT